MFIYRPIPPPLNLSRKVQKQKNTRDAGFQSGASPDPPVPRGELLATCTHLNALARPRALPQAKADTKHDV